MQTPETKPKLTGRTSIPAPTILIRPTRYVVRMIVFVAIVAVVAALLHETAYRFFLRNPPLNALILGVLATGIWLAFRSVLSLEPEVNWIQRFRQNEASGVAPPLLAAVAAMMNDPQRPAALTANNVRNLLDGIYNRLEERRETSRI